MGALVAEEQGVRHTLGGPGGWYIPQDAFYLKECYGQSKSFGSIDAISKAAQLRTLHTHDCTRKAKRILSSTSVADMHFRLQACIRDPIEADRIVEWGEWYQQAHVSVLYRNEHNLREQGLSLRECLRALAGGEPQPWGEEVRAKQKRELQKFITAELKNRS